MKRALGETMRKISPAFCAVFVLILTLPALSADIYQEWQSIQNINKSISNSQYLIAACSKLTKVHPEDSRAQEAQKIIDKFTRALQLFPGEIRKEGIPFRNGCALNLEGAAISGGIINLKNERSGLMAPHDPGKPQGAKVLSERSENISKVATGMSIPEVVNILGNCDDSFEQADGHRYQKVIIYDLKDQKTAILWFDEAEALTMLHVAKTVEKEKAPEPSKKSKSGEDNLVRAVNSGDASAVKLLLTQGANPNIFGSNGVSPLAAACYKGNIEIVKILLENKADPKGKDLEYQITALHAAADAGKPEVGVIKLLIEAGADVNAQNRKGETALMIVSRRGYDDVVSILLEAGADPAIKSNNGNTALSSALYYGDNKVAEIIRQNRNQKGGPDSKDAQGITKGQNVHIPDEFCGKWVESTNGDQNLTMTSDSILWKRKAEGEETFPSEKLKLLNNGQKITFAATQIAYWNRATGEKPRRPIQVEIENVSGGLKMAITGGQTSVQDSGLVVISRPKEYRFERK